MLLTLTLTLAVAVPVTVTVPVPVALSVAITVAALRSIRREVEEMLGTREGPAWLRDPAAAYLAEVRDRAGQLLRQLRHQRKQQQQQQQQGWSRTGSGRGSSRGGGSGGQRAGGGVRAAGGREGGGGRQRPDWWPTDEDVEQGAWVYIWKHPGEADRVARAQEQQERLGRLAGGGQGRRGEAAWVRQVPYRVGGPLFVGLEGWAAARVGPEAGAGVRRGPEAAAAAEAAAAKCEGEGRGWRERKGVGAGVVGRGRAKVSCSGMVGLHKRSTDLPCYPARLLRPPAGQQATALAPTA